MCGLIPRRLPSCRPTHERFLPPGDRTALMAFGFVVVRNWIQGSGRSEPAQLAELAAALLDGPVHLRLTSHEDVPAVWRREQEDGSLARLVLLHDARRALSEDGAVRFLPGSHAFPGRLTAAERALLAHADPRSCRDAVGGVIAATDPGDVLVFGVSVWHLRTSVPGRTVCTAAPHL